MLCCGNLVHQSGAHRPKRSKLALGWTTGAVPAWPMPKGLEQQAARLQALGIAVTGDGGFLAGVFVEARP